MKLFPDDHETIAGTAWRLRQGETTCLDVLQSCLDRIDDLRACEQRKEYHRVVMDEMLRWADALLTPAALGAAPDPSTTGDPVFNSPWSLLGLPTVSFPIGLSADGLPLAVQLVGRAGFDPPLLRTAEWCETVIRSANRGS